MTNRAWYGKAFYFVELPRRFMVSLWGVPTFWFVLPQHWIAAIIAIGCIAYDLLVTSRAPDLRITKEEIQAKLGDRLYYLTTQELTQRLAWLAVALGATALVGAYWFFNNQQPTFFGRMGTTSIVLIAIAYVSTIGIPLRTRNEIPANEKPVTWDIIPDFSKTLMIHAFGLPIFIWLGIGGLWVLMWGMEPYKGDLGYTGSFLTYICCLAILYYLTFLYVLLAPMAILDRKINFIQPAKENDHA